MARIRISLLIVLALSGTLLVSAPPSAHAVQTLWDGTSTVSSGTSGTPRPTIDPTTGEPDVTGNNSAPSQKVGSGTTSLTRAPQETVSVLLKLWGRLLVARFVWR